jgi:diaminohydroxyphosphoribosylaminopyrimidine deaminase/5-amino-6-(5-phosphoribosylamino)uracil reductase
VYKKAVIATLDPQSAGCRQGMQKLLDAGIESRTGVMEEQARKLNEIFFNISGRRNHW